MLCCCVDALAAPAPQTLIDVTDPANLPKYAVTDGKAEVVRTDAGPALRLAFGHESAYPNLKLLPDPLGYATDWSRAAFLAVTVGNPTDAAVKVNVRVDSEAVRDRGRQGGTEVAPGQTVRMLLTVGGRPPIIGMRGQPPLPYPRREGDVQIVHNGVALDAKRITQMQVYLAHPDADHTLLLYKLELIPVPAPLPAAFVDRFGQYNGADWPGKLHSEDEFPKRIRNEEQYFQANPPLPDRDQYGGWKDGPQLEATGRFRVQKQAGKWWLVDPEGRLFWSSGITCVRFNAETIVAGREQYFEWLPATDNPFARFYTAPPNRRLFDFFAVNVYRKYGDDFANRFYDVTMKRLPSWGINTIGNWSAPETWRLRRVPYTLPINVPGVPMFVATSRLKAGLEKKKWFPDPFDPKFRAGLEQQLAAQAEFKGDPWLLGVFIHNELPWTLGSPWQSANQAPAGIAALCLQESDGSFQAKQALLDWLKAKYPTIADLNRAWGTQLADWETAAAPFQLTAGQRKQALADLTELERTIAEQYFRVCREALDKHFPGVLYLGCRFSGMYDRHFVEVSRKYCDVVSFNIYAELPTDRTADELAAELDFPVVIGEFHFGALDRGMFDPGLRPAKDQAERAEKYVAYTREAAAAPWCVGAHWFQYLDQPLTGRADGENYNVGFVDATDDPYPEMREAARKVNGELYGLRAGG
ncbi:MAG: hypothetical protein COY42_04695 [Armatimonadetes bacterium CG_4_10_14_0_8_um_filter_66_14]|nr:MAG: hypothetical protein AUJ96_11805 [Armatimonadetes bacterium CG2_30_66_41]PIX47846.1 MAG: hypothetical protein COZ57_07415 [Armatimonadetes bacterium CG_4_8_14_3_um_filter_66_20]PIZ49142.1 MAG: hypothetical protein COY42_04695 [Armatimonadetes bacterium CG_4_10_14_0_8_um_filter_66_14]